MMHQERKKRKKQTFPIIVRTHIGFGSLTNRVRQTSMDLPSGRRDQIDKRGSLVTLKGIFASLNRFYAYMRKAVKKGQRG